MLTAENSTVTESEVDTEADTDRESIVDRLPSCHVKLSVFFPVFSVV